MDADSRPPQSLWRRFLARPATRLGWWAFGLAAAFVLMFIINSTLLRPWETVLTPWRQAVMPFYGIAMLACGLAAGIAGLIAVVRRGERSWMVWPAILPGVMVAFLLLGEFLIPH